MKAFYDSKPTTLQEVGNGAVLYRYDIKETQSTTEGNETTEGSTQYECQEVTVWPPLTSNRITEAVITDRWDTNQEQKLVNEYNAAKLGLYGDETSAEAKARIEAYTAYLRERAQLKQQVDADCKALGIN